MNYSFSSCHVSSTCACDLHVIKQAAILIRCDFNNYSVETGAALHIVKYILLVWAASPNSTITYMFQ